MHQSLFKRPASIHHIIGIFLTALEKAFALHFWQVGLLFSFHLLIASRKKILGWFMSHFPFSVSFEILVFWHVGQSGLRVRPTLLCYQIPVWLSIVCWSLWPTSLSCEIMVDHEWDYVHGVSHSAGNGMAERWYLTVNCTPVLWTQKPCKNTGWEIWAWAPLEANLE